MFPRVSVHDLVDENHNRAARNLVMDSNPTSTLPFSSNGAKEAVEDLEQDELFYFRIVVFRVICLHIAAIPR